jgi:hypothetical protein
VECCSDILKFELSFFRLSRLSKSEENMNHEEVDLFARVWKLIVTAGERIVRIKITSS